MVSQHLCLQFLVWILQFSTFTPSLWIFNREKRRRAPRDSILGIYTQHCLPPRGTSLCTPFLTVLTAQPHMPSSSGYQQLHVSGRHHSLLGQSCSRFQGERSATNFTARDKSSSMNRLSAHQGVEEGRCTASGVCCQCVHDVHLSAF